MLVARIAWAFRAAIVVVPFACSADSVSVSPTPDPVQPSPAPETLGDTGGGSGELPRPQPLETPEPPSDARILGDPGSQTQSFGLRINAENPSQRKKQLYEVQRCYRDRQEEDPGMTGRVVVRFELNEHGQVRRASLVSSSLPDAVSECMVAKIRRWRFPDIDDPDGLVVTYPFNVHPAS